MRFPDHVRSLARAIAFGRNLPLEGQIKRLFFVFTMIGASLFLGQELSISTGGVLGRVMAVTLVSWLLLSSLELYRKHSHRPLLIAMNSLAIVALGGADLGDPMANLPMIVFPLIFFTSQFGKRRTVMLTSSIYFVAYVGAIVFANALDVRVLAQFPAAIVISYVLQLSAETVARHSRAVARNAELNAMSSILMAAEAIDEVQSAAVIAGTALVDDSPELIFAVFEIGETGHWNVAASAGHDAWHLRHLELKGDDLNAALLAISAVPAYETRAVEVVPVASDELLCVFVWIVSRPFDRELRASAETLAGQVAESIRRLEVEASIRLLLEHSIDALIVVGEDSKIVYASPAVEALTGRTPDQVVGRSLSTLVHRQHVTELVKHLHGDISAPTVFSLRWGHQATNSWKETHTTISLMRQRGNQRRWVFNVHDVSEQTALEFELRHAQKLESVGRLAAGVAHEINTPIQFVGHNLRFVGTSFGEITAAFRRYRDIAQQHAPEQVVASLEKEIDVDDIEYLQEEIPLAVSQAIEGTDRVAEIVRAMKVFGHPDAATAQAIDINGSLESTLIIAQNEIKTIATVDMKLEAIPTIMGFAGDLNQVFLNLVVNACHAMEDQSKDGTQLGRLTVSTKEEDGAVIIAIADTGSGIPVSARDHVFEPFFTTKDVGRGTGQGLALAHAVIEERHGGRIWFETEEGKGTTFFVKLFADGKNVKGAKNATAAFT